jgi:hypothetical protein
MTSKIKGVRTLCLVLCLDFLNKEITFLIPKQQGRGKTKRAVTKTLHAPVALHFSGFSLCGALCTTIIILSWL